MIIIIRNPENSIGNYLGPYSSPSAHIPRLRISFPAVVALTPEHFIKG